MSSLKEEIQQLWNLPEPRITIDQAIAICQRHAPKHPKLKEVIRRIEELRRERDQTRNVAEEAMSDAAWEKSDMKKWADKQRRDPDND